MKCFFLIAVLSLLCRAVVQAGYTGTEPGSWPRQSMSADEVPQGLQKSDWQSIRAAHESWKHMFHPQEGGGHMAYTPGQQWRSQFDERGFVTTPDNGGWAWGMELRSYGFPGHEQHTAASQGRIPHCPPAGVRAEGQRLTRRWGAVLEEWYVNDPRGLEHGFTLKERPAGATGTVPLYIELALRGSLRAIVLAGGQSVSFVDDKGGTALTYGGLKAWDADNKILKARMTTAPDGALRFEVEEKCARYPITIDPIANQAYLKQQVVRSNSADVRFGRSVAVSGDTVVIGAPGEDSSTTGVNSAPNQGASNAGAAYVFVRSGNVWSQQAYLKPNNTGAGDLFGESVAISGDTVVIGAPQEGSSTSGVNSSPNESAIYAGAAYVFLRSGVVWSQQAYLKPHNTGAADYFGDSVAISGDTLVIGALWEDSGSAGINSAPNENAQNAGAGYVFVRSGTVWSQQAYLKADNAGISDYFGSSVAISGNTVVIGAPGEDSSTTVVNSVPNENARDAGAAYVFVRSGSVWTQHAYLKADNAGAEDWFGCAVGVSGNTVVVGAKWEDSSTTMVNSVPNEDSGEAGAAYVFLRSGSTWIHQAYLKASNPNDSDSFGSSVAISGETVVIGAPGEDSSTTGMNSVPNEDARDAGAAYVFVRSGTVWIQRAYLKVSNTGADDQLGKSVAISGDTVVIGAEYEDSGTTGVNSTPNEDAYAAGAAYVFVGTGSTWIQQAYLKASYAGPGDQFGYAVAISGDTVVVGAYAEDGSSTGVNGIPNGLAPDAGAAYVYVRSGGIWSQQAYLKAHQVNPEDRFGVSVAISGDTLVVGANGEDSSTVGVNSQPNESAEGAGAAYVFVRSGTTWFQQAYLKANEVDFYDRFGHAVAVSGDTVVIGAFAEDSSTPGVNMQANEYAADSGAAYVFKRNFGFWRLEAYLKASNVSVGDYFGVSVALSGDTAVIGAQNEDSSTMGVNSSANENAVQAGAAYVFERIGNYWYQQAYLKAHQVSPDDHFGNAVAISGNTAVVAANLENGSAGGINPLPDENSAEAGAAYVFVRNGTVWSQEAYLKASQVSANDRFGTSVAVAGDTVVVGASAEDSSTVGINSTPNENAMDAGAAYVFVRSGTVWSQQAYLKASNTDAGDQFGVSVGVSEDIVVVGARGEDSGTTGVNSIPDESDSDAGASYIFTGLGPDLTPPYGGELALSPGSRLDIAEMMTITFTGWQDESPPLSYVVLIDNVVVSPQGSMSSRNLTAPTSPGMHTLKGRIYDAMNNMTEVVKNFTINTAQEGWREQYFGTASNSGNAADDFDYDRDGLTNLMEWASGLDPTISSSHITAAVLFEGQIAFTYTRSVGAVDAGTSFLVEWSDTLSSASWSLSGVTQEVVSDNGTHQQVRAMLPFGSLGRRFVRLRVVGPL